MYIRRTKLQAMTRNKRVSDLTARVRRKEVDKVFYKREGWMLFQQLINKINIIITRYPKFRIIKVFIGIDRTAKNTTLSFRNLRLLNANFILGVKPGSHIKLFEGIESWAATRQGFSPEPVMPSIKTTVTPSPGSTLAGNFWNRVLRGHGFFISKKEPSDISARVTIRMDGGQ